MAVKRYIIVKPKEGEPVFFLTGLHQDYPDVLLFSLSSNKKLATPFGSSTHAQGAIGTLKASSFLEEAFIDLDAEGEVDPKKIERKPNDYSWPM